MEILDKSGESDTGTDTHIFILQKPHFLSCGQPREQAIPANAGWSSETTLRGFFYCLGFNSRSSLSIDELTLPLTLGQSEGVIPCLLLRERKCQEKSLRKFLHKI